MEKGIEDELCADVMRICNIKSEIKDTKAVYVSPPGELTLVISVSEQTQRTHEIKLNLFSLEEKNDPTYTYKNISVENKIKLDLIVLFLKSAEPLRCNVVKKSDPGNHIYHFLVFTVGKNWSSRFILEPSEEGKYELTSKIEIAGDAEAELPNLTNRIPTVQL